jgi:hypothetical protein
MVEDAAACMTPCAAINRPDGRGLPATVAFAFAFLGFPARGTAAKFYGFAATENCRLGCRGYYEFMR